MLIWRCEMVGGIESQVDRLCKEWPYGDGIVICVYSAHCTLWRVPMGVCQMRSHRCPFMMWCAFGFAACKAWRSKSTFCWDKPVVWTICVKCMKAGRLGSEEGRMKSEVLRRTCKCAENGLAFSFSREYFLSRSDDCALRTRLFLTFGLSFSLSWTDWHIGYLVPRQPSLPIRRSAV